MIFMKTTDNYMIFNKHVLLVIDFKYNVIKILSVKWKIISA